MTDTAGRALLRAVVGASVIVATASFATMLTRHGAGRLPESDVPTVLMICVGLGAVVWVAAGQQPRNRLLWVLAAFIASSAWFAASTTARSILVPEVPFRLTVDAVTPADLPRAAAWLEYVTLPISSLASALLLTYGLLLFPDGRLPSPRWKWVSFGAAVVLAVGFAFDLFVWHPGSTYVINEHPLFHLLSPVDILLPLVALTAVVVRFRRADADERTRFKWVVAGLSVFVPLTLLGFISGLTAITAVAMVVLIATFGIAITRHHLFDVDLVISRTFVFGTLAAFIGVVYVGVVVGFGSLIGSGDEPNAVLSVVATALVAVGFQPVRRRLERVANRLVFGRRATPYEVLSEFSRRVAATSDDLLDDAARSLAEGTRAERVVVSVMVDEETVEAAAWPQEPPSTSTESVSFPITDGELELGSLDVHLLAGQDLRDDDRRLAEQLASGMGLALRNQLLTERLEARVEELRESRRRLVAVQDETRRRLERDLHDGAQQQLVALKVKLGLGKAIAEKDGAARTAELLGRLSGEADQAVDAMREFARGVYPPLLEAEGLASAITAQARRAPIPVSVDSDGIGRYPREIESTVYFCVLEALRNTMQHADALQATVTLTQSNGSLEFQVTDDGAGFDPNSNRGVGLTAMADRLDALTGELSVYTEPGNGTTLTGTIPVPAEVPA